MFKRISCQRTELSALNHLMVLMVTVTFDRWGEFGGCSRMVRIVYRLKPNGKVYASLEEAYRDAQGRLRQRHLKSLGAVSGKNVPQETRKAATERYRQALRDNAYQFGRSWPGERYEREARAREEYQKYLAGAAAGEFTKDLTPEEYHSLSTEAFWRQVDARKDGPTEEQSANTKSVTLRRPIGQKTSTRL